MRALCSNGSGLDRVPSTGKRRRPAYRALIATLAGAVAPLTLGSPAGAALDEAPRSGLRTTLPLVVIQTSARIVDDPKVTGSMRVIDHGRGRLNRVRDRGTDYDGAIGIEVRGQSSRRNSKQQFAVETRKASGENRNVSLLGLPAENDWILYSAGTDSSLMRNVLAYWTARKLGSYASRTRFVELVLNGRYWGVYVLMEKPKLDKARVRVSDGDITGGYLLESSWDNKLGRADRYFRAPVTQKPIVFYDPEGKDIRKDRAAWISDYVSKFEVALYGESFRDPNLGYRAYLDLRAAVDYTLINEFFKNQDAFKTSTFLHKSSGGKLVLGPVWDLDISMGNSSQGRSAQLEGWIMRYRPWGLRLYQDPAFVDLMAERWRALRQQGLLRSILRLADANARLLKTAAARNVRRWPATKAFNPEVARLKSWLTRRAAWIDANIEALRQP